LDVVSVLIEEDLLSFEDELSCKGEEGVSSSNEVPLEGMEKEED
jgi:hypothetical protein